LGITTKYSVNLAHDITANILLVAGGGSGAMAGQYNPAGGGGGGEVLLKEGVSMKSGVYKFFVGKGGSKGTTSIPSGQNTDGVDTKIEKKNSIIYRTKGGGRGGSVRHPSQPGAYWEYQPGNGGSAGGTGRMLAALAISTKYNVDGYGHDAVDRSGAGAGGSGSMTPSGDNTGANGGPGIAVDISSQNVIYGAGGGAGGRYGPGSVGMGGNNETGHGAGTRGRQTPCLIKAVVVHELMQILEPESE